MKYYVITTEIIVFRNIYSGGYAHTERENKQEQYLIKSSDDSKIISINGLNIHFREFPYFISKNSTSVLVSTFDSLGIYPTYNITFPAKIVSTNEFDTEDAARLFIETSK